LGVFGGLEDTSFGRMNELIKSFEFDLYCFFNKFLNLLFSWGFFQASLIFTPCPIYIFPFADF